MGTIATETEAVRAFVLQVNQQEMRVCDVYTLRELRICTPEAACFRAGDRICVEYRGDGMMRSFPRIRENQIDRITRF